MPLHRRTPSAMGAVLVEGEVCRESNVADLLVNKRWMQLLSGGASSGAGSGSAPTEPPALASFRHKGDAEPSKASLKAELVVHMPLRCLWCAFLVCMQHLSEAGAAFAGGRAPRGSTTRN